MACFLLAGGRGIILRYAIGYNLLGFKWAANHGLDSLPNKKATNELMDLNHAVIATYCDSILSDEPSVVQMRQDILEAMDAKPFQSSDKPTTSDSAQKLQPPSGV